MMKDDGIPPVALPRAIVRTPAEQSRREILQLIGLGLLRTPTMPNAGGATNGFVLASSRRIVCVLVGGYAASAIAYPRLPGPFLPGSLERPLVALTLPTAALLVYVLLGSLWMRDRAQCRNVWRRATAEAMVFRIVLFLVGLHVLVLANLIGIPASGAWAGRLVVILLGLAVASLGNLRDYHPRFNIPRTAVNLVVVLGLLISTAGFLLPAQMMGGVIAIAITAVAIVGASYRRYAQGVRSDNATLEPDDAPRQRFKDDARRRRLKIVR
jgi:hypothetical protein